MGAGCSTGAARHIIAASPDPASTPVHALLKDGRVAVYQHAGSGACVFVPLLVGAGSSDADATMAAAAAERRLGPEWRRVPVAASAQARVLEALALVTMPPSQTLATPTAAVTSASNSATAASGGEAPGLVEEAADEEELLIGEPVEEAWPPAWAEAGGDGIFGEEEEDDDEDDDDPLVAAQRQQRRQQLGQLMPALRCRVCGREVPNKALLNEHLAACLLVAEAREQTRGTDDGLRGLAGGLRRMLEEQMRAALHGGMA